MDNINLEETKVYIFSLLPGTMYIETPEHRLSPHDADRYIAMDVTEGIDKNFLEDTLKILNKDQLELDSSFENLPMDVNKFLKVLLIENNIIEDKDNLLNELYNTTTNYLENFDEER